MTVIGSAYVNIRAITTELERDIRKTIESITDNITIKVDADVSSATASIEKLAENVRDQSVNIDADTSAARSRLDVLADDALGDQTITVHADTLPARSEFDNMLDDMDGENVGVDVDLDDTVAKTRLALLTRFRTLKINVIANSGPVIKLGAALGRLSGLRVATEDAKKLVHEFANIDKAVPTIAKMATLFGTVAGGIMSSVGGLLTLGASLGSIISMAAVAAPGMATGFIVGIGTLIVALKDFGKQLPQVTAQYKTLGATIKSNYWAEARESIRDMAQTLFPQFQKGLAGTAGALGRWSAVLADSLKVQLNGGVLEAMFANLSKSIDIASRGLDPLVRAMVDLGYVGGEYLPRLAGWFADVSTKFGDFIALAVDTGDIYRWVEDGIYNLKRLGSLIGEISGLFGGLTRAAKLAGSDGLGTLLRNFERMNNAVNSPEGLKSLTQIFEGANAVASSLGDGIYKIFGALGSASGAIKSSLESVAGTLGAVADAFSRIISNPEFQTGMTAMFDGIEKGANSLFGVLGSTGPKLGSLLSIIGSLAANIGGILGAALEVSLPLITAFKQAIDPLIPILGDALIKIIQELGPTFEALAASIGAVAPAVSAVVGFVADLIVGIVDTLGPALPGIIAGILAFAGAFKATVVIQSVVSNISKAINFMKLLAAGNSIATASQIAFNVAMSLNPVALVVAGIAALIAIVIVAYNNVGWFKDAVDGAMKFIGDSVAGLVGWWNDNVVPMFEGAAKAAGEFFGGFGQWATEALGAIGDFFGGFGKGAEDASASLGGFLGEIGSTISDAFNGVVEFVSGIFTNIANAIQSAIAVYINIWSTGFGIIRDVFVNIWNGLVAVFTPIANLIGTIIGAVIEVVVAIWTAGWEIVSTIFYGIWINLVRFFTPIIQSIQDTISTVVTAVQTTWNTVWQAISDFFTNTWNMMVAIYSPILQGIWDFIVAVGAGIAAAWNATWQGIIDFFTNTWNMMVAIYSPILQGIWDFIVAVGAGIAATWNSTWQGISDFFSAIWNGIVAVVSPIIQSISDTITAIITGIQTTWNNTWTAIGLVISVVWNNIVNAISGFVNTIQTTVRNVLTTIGNIGSDILTTVSNFPSMLVNAGTDLINGLIRGINSAKDSVITTIKNIASGALDAIKNFFGIKSPSRVMRDQVGKQIGAGLAIGIEQSISRVSKATAALTDAAMMSVPDIQLPSIRNGTGPASMGANRAPVVSRNSVFGLPETASAIDPMSRMSGAGGPSIAFNVNPSQGLSETQIGEAAMRELYWQLANR